MSNLSRTDLRSINRYLVANSIDREGMDDNTKLATATSNGWVSPSGATPAPQAPAPQAPAPQAPAPQAPQAPAPQAPAPASTDTASALAALVASLTPQAPPTLDETAIKAMVEKYSNPITTLEVNRVDEQASVKIKGAHPQLERIVKRLATYNVYCYGPAGAGKTTLAMQAAESLGLDFYSTGALLQKFELLGFIDAGGVYQETEFYKAYTEGALFLFDEIDASTAMATIPFNAAIANGFCAFPNGTVKMHPNFKCIAAANTNGQGATANYKRNALDGATLDRFKMIKIDYDEQLELRLALAEYARHGGDNESIARQWVATVQKTRKLAAEKRIDVIISPRASIGGAGILAQGDTTAMAVEETFGARLSQDQIIALNLGGVL